MWHKADNKKVQKMAEREYISVAWSVPGVKAEYTSEDGGDSYQHYVPAHERALKSSESDTKFSQAFCFGQ